MCQTKVLMNERGTPDQVENTVETAAEAHDESAGEIAVMTEVEAETRTVDIADTMMTESTGIVVIGIVPGLAAETITGADRPRDTAAETMIITDTDGWNVPTPQAHADATLIVTGTERTMIVDTNLRGCSLDSKRIEAINNDCPRTFGGKTHRYLIHATTLIYIHAH